MKLRSHLARVAPHLLERAQRSGIFPNPAIARSARRLGQLSADGAYGEEVIGRHRADPILTDRFVRPEGEWGDQYLHKLQSQSTAMADQLSFGYFDVPGGRFAPVYGVHWSRAGNFIDGYCSDAALKNPKYELPRLALPWAIPTQKISSGILLVPAWYHNFYHWVVDILPRLQLLDGPIREGIPIILPTGLSASWREMLACSLAHIGFSDARCIELPGFCYEFERMIVPTRMANPLDISPRQHAFVRGCMIDEIAAKPRHDLLYISRRDASVRRIANEAEIEEILHRRGFRTVTLAGKSVREQAALFSGARAIIGHHGAGLVNLAYCAPGTIALEIFQHGHFAACFARLAQLGGLTYGYGVGAAVGVDTHLDPQQLTGLIDRLGL